MDVLRGSAAGLVTALLATLSLTGPTTAQPPGSPRLSVPPTSTTFSVDGEWAQICAGGRSEHVAVYDPVRERMVVYGGLFPSYSVLELALTGHPGWGVIQAAGALPEPRRAPVAVYDPVRDRMIVFGGLDGSYLNDVWVLSLGANPTWSPLSPSGSPPAGRWKAAGIYDPIGDRMIVYGGQGAGGTSGEVWALELSGSPAWSLLTVGGGLQPDGRYEHTAVYDPARNRMLVFGGTTAGGPSGDGFALNLTASPTWSYNSPPGGPGPSGPVSTDHATYDPARDCMLVFRDDVLATNALWKLDLSVFPPVWSHLTSPAPEPGPRYASSAIFDPINDRVVVYGGEGSLNRWRDVWSFDMATSSWEDIRPQGPGERYFHAGIFDPIRDRMVVFGGAATNDTWALPSDSTDWVELLPAGPPPAPRFGLSAVYDPVRDRMLIFGGGGANDTWALDLAGGSSWSQLDPLGSLPTGRSGHSAIYDPIGDRMIIFGGRESSGAFLNDTWALNLEPAPGVRPEWEHLVTGAPLPEKRTTATAIYDPLRGRMIVFGGHKNADGVYAQGLWSLSLLASPAWTEIPGTHPARKFHTAVYDPVRDRMVVHSGGSNRPGEVMALSLATHLWSELLPAGMTTPPFERFGHVSVYDPLRDRMLTHAGQLRSDTWSLTWGEPVLDATTPPANDRLTLSTPRPNPFRSHVTFDFDLPTRARVRLTIHDLSGRQLRVIEDSMLPAGQHSRTWEGLTGTGMTVPPGVYFARLTVAGRRLRQKVVSVR